MSSQHVQSCSLRCSETASLRRISRLAAYQRWKFKDTVRSKSAMGIPVMPPSPFTGQRRMSRVCRRISSLVALPVQMPSPRETNSHDGVTDGRGQFWKFPGRARATLPSGASSSPVNVPDAVQNRSEFQPPPCVPKVPVKVRASCSVMVNEPEQPPQLSVFPVSRLRYTFLPDALHRPVNEGKFWAGSAAGVADDAGFDVTGDGPVGVALVTPPHAAVSTIAGIMARSPVRVPTFPTASATSVPLASREPPWRPYS